MAFGRSPFPRASRPPIQIGTDVHPNTRELLGAGEFRCPCKDPGIEIAV